jgi:multidrug efflux pump subunit AcrB
VENQIYFDSQSTNDGQLALTSTCEVGSNLDIAQVQVQNTIQIAQPKLPEEVQRRGWQPDPPTAGAADDKASVVRTASQR